MSASLAPECNEVKEYVYAAWQQDIQSRLTAIPRRYDSCFLKWYSESVTSCFRSCCTHTHRVEFLRGNPSTDECEPLFKEYKTCLTVSGRPPQLDQTLISSRKL